MTRRDKERVKVLDRRIAHLSERIAKAERAGDGHARDVSWDRSERAALIWVVRILKAADRGYISLDVLYETGKKIEQREREAA